MKSSGLVVAWVALVACGDNIKPAAAPPARIETQIAPSPLTAGDTAHATCIVYDADDNVLDDQTPALVIAPVDAGTQVTDLDAIVTRAGHYTAQCVLPDLPGDAAPFDVVHALPAKLVIGKMPDQQVYAIAATVAITHAVADRYDNPIADAPVITASTPLTGVGPITTVAPDAYSYGGEGKYRIDALVMPPTDQMQAVTASLDLVVNQHGPTIGCAAPLDGAMLDLADGATLTVQGSAYDVNGTMSATVNGQPVTVATDGTFSTQVTSHFGINFVDIVATDAYGVQTTKVCTFLAASQWAAPASLYADTLALGLAQGAIDDGNRSGPIGSLGDLLFAVENSTGIRDAIDNALSAANPLKPSSCDKQVCVLGVCACVLSSQIDYQSSSIDGPNTNSLALAGGGLATQAQINNIHINLRAHGHAAGIPFDTSGPVDIADIHVGLVLDTTLSSGHPNISVRPGSVSTSVGSISTHFSGIDGFIINLIVSLAQGTVRNTVASQVTGFVTNNFDQVLSGVVGGLHIDSLGAAFDVQRLDGSGAVTLAFSAGISSLSTTASHMLFGLGTRLAGPIANAYPTLGVAVPAGPVLADPGFAGQSAALAAHVAILDQALHALWKANFFTATVQTGATTVAVTTRLPPVATFDGTGNVQLSLGDVDLVCNGGSLPPNLSLTLGARAHSGVALAGNALQFTGLVVDEIHLSTDYADLSASEQQNLEQVVHDLVQQLADQSLNHALPALPIPSFPISGLTGFGIPNGQLGLTSPALATTPPHFTLRGGIGIH